MSSRILVIGGTGTIGRHLVTASLSAGHPTAVLVRPATAAADPAKASLLEAFSSSGATLVHGDINDGEGLVAAVKQADVVISAVGHTSPEEVESQLKILAAIQEAGNIKNQSTANLDACMRACVRAYCHRSQRFVPSEYGCDVELAEHMLEPARSTLGAKVTVREALKVSGIPHTIIRSNLCQEFFLPRAGNPEAAGPPDTVATIFGDGTVQEFFVNVEDMSKLAIRAVEDPRTLNKILHVRPPTNLCSLNQLVSLWEKKTGKTLQKRYIAEQELVNKVQGSPFPLNFQLAIVHATLVPGGAMQHGKATGGAPPAGAEEVEATELYPDIEYITCEQFLDRLP